MIQDTPFAEDLRATIERAYGLSPARVPASLTVCQCNVCMSPETRARIIATPVRELSEDLIREYTNSAHGVPPDLTDLMALLPRYLDLMAQDAEVDWNSVGADLYRFGQARAEHPEFPGPQMDAVLNDWARAMILHFGHLDATDRPQVTTPISLMTTLVTGGWPVGVVTDALDALFARPDIGPAALAQALRQLGGQLQDGRLRFWALSRYSVHAIEPLAAWLNGLLASPLTEQIATDPALPDDLQVWIAPLMTMAGRITPASLGE